MYIYVIFIFAFLIRLVNLNQSLWLDETIVAKVVKTIPLLQIPFQLSPGDVHPPLYYMVISLWTSLFGYSEISLRMPSVLFSLIAGWYVYKIAGELKGKKFGLWAAAFFLFNPLIIYYSQEARMHMMATMFLSAALYHYIQILKKTPKDFAKDVSWLHNNALLFNIFSALAMCTFYGSAFFIAGMIVAAGFIYGHSKGKIIDWIRPRRMTQMSYGVLISLLILSPLLYLQMLNAHAGLADLKNWSLVLGKAELKNVLMIFIKFATGRLSWFPKWSYYLVAGIPTALTWIAVLFGMKKNKLFGYLFILPLLFGLFISLWAPMMMYFRFLYLIPIMSILVAIGLSQNKMLKGITLFVFVVFSFIYLFIPQFHREDWKGMSTQLNPQIPVYMILPSSDPIAYYRTDVLVFELRNIQDRKVPETINVIPYTSEIYGLNYADLLQKIGCIKETQTNFRGNVILEKWKCLRNA